MIMTENETIINRLERARQHLGMSINKFETVLGLSSNSFGAAVRKNRDMSTKVVQAFSEYFPNFNMEWIVTGNGEMLKKNEINSFSELNSVAERPSEYKKEDPFELLLKMYLDKESIKMKIEEVVEEKMHSLEDDFEKTLGKLDPKLLNKMLKKLGKSDQ